MARPDISLTKKPWRAAAWVLGSFLGILLLSPLLVVGFVFGADAPRDLSLDGGAWRAGASWSDPYNPRRHMTASAQRWLDGEQPTQAEVRARLGAPDSSTRTERGVSEDFWNIGCYQDALCISGSGLIVSYPDGRARSRTETY